MSTKRVKVIVKPVGKAPHIEYTDNTLEAFQRIVDGYIETVTVCTDLVIICNEEGRLRGLPYNCKVFGVDFVGDIALVGRSGSNFADCPLKLADANKLFP